MTVRAFKMQLKPDNSAEYRRRHDALWPELADLLRQSGISNYFIFHDADSNALFAVMDVLHEDALADLSDHPVMRRWWDHMAPLMEVAPDNRPFEWPLIQMFHLA
jgi:L-rhamnose mutarotase